MFPKYSSSAVLHSTKCLARKSAITCARMSGSKYTACGGRIRTSAIIRDDVSTQRPERRRVQRRRDRHARDHVELARSQQKGVPQSHNAEEEAGAVASSVVKDTVGAADARLRCKKIILKYVHHILQGRHSRLDHPFLPL
jgi:hypothetical protein